MHLLNFHVVLVYLLFISQKKKLICHIFLKVYSVKFTLVNKLLKINILTYFFRTLTLHRLFVSLLT